MPKIFKYPLLRCFYWILCSIFGSAQKNISHYSLPETKMGNKGVNDWENPQMIEQNKEAGGIEH